MKNTAIIFFTAIIAVLAPCLSTAEETPTQEKIGVLITGWGMPAGYNEGYAFHGSDLARIGDRTEYIGQSCKIGHVGEFPYQSHINMIPWAVTFLTEEWEEYYDYHGIYKLENGMYVSPIADIPSVNPADIPAETPITPLKDVVMTAQPKPYPVDPRDNTDYLAGWYQIGSFSKQYPNNYNDFMESMIPTYIRYYGLMSSPTSPPEVVNNPPLCLQQQDEYLDMLLTTAFGDRIDIRRGFYSPIPGVTEREDDVAEAMATEGVTKFVLARETTDHNRYANEFLTGNYIKERLCEINKLDTAQIYQSRQVGRTPEFNAMNIRNMRPFIEAYAPGSTIGIIYVTRGLPWNKDERSHEFGSAHPWSREVYHENAYLNFLSWKKAVKAAFEGSYNLVFTKDGIDSDFRTDNYFTYGVNKKNENAGVFINTRDAIQTMKEYGIYNILVVPCHWNYDCLDTIILNKQISDLPMTPKTDVEAGIFEYTHCEDASGAVVECGSRNSAAQITVAPSYTNFPEEFATAYYVVLRGALERFGLYPEGEEPLPGASQLITKLDGGTVAVTDNASMLQGTKIEIPGDPYPDRPESFYYYLDPSDNYSVVTNAVPVNDPADTNDCMWEDTVITIGGRTNPPAMQTLDAAGPAVHFGPYRTFFNRNVTITIPYSKTTVKGKPVMACIYNHVTEDWDLINPVTINADAGTVSFTTQVTGLFQAASAEPPFINLVSFTAHPGSKEVLLTWTTEFEIGSKGFNLYRADAEDGEYTKINEALVQPKGNPTTGATYTLTDKGLRNRKTYYYKLEDIDHTGAGTMHGPISVKPRFVHAFF